MTLFIFLYFFLVCFQILSHHKKIKNRSQFYLCLKFLHVNQRFYIKEIANLNKLILASITPEIRNSLILKQEESYLSYLKNFRKNRFCDLKQSLSFIKNNPYKRAGLKFIRGADQTTIVARGSWKNEIKSKYNLVWIFYTLGNSLQDSPQVRFQEKVFSN